MTNSKNDDADSNEMDSLSLVEDESGLEQDEKEPEIDVPFDPSKIDIQVKPLAITSLLSRLKFDELDLTPDFQRQANLWDQKRKSRLVESILLRIPLPSFYFSENDDAVFSVVDGLQRLCTLFHFMDVAELNRAAKIDLKPLKLTGLQYLKELEGKSFTDLDAKYRRRVSELEITANIIRPGTPAAVKFNVFARLNQGGMPLNAQEIRNAIYFGNWRVKIQEMAKSKTFLSVTDNKIKTQRQHDIELVLRFVALLQLGGKFKRPAGQTLDDFLNETVENVLFNWSDLKWKKAALVFETSLNSARRLFGEQVFRKSVGYSFKSPINRGLFEAQLIALSVCSESDVDKLVKNKKHVHAKLLDNMRYGGLLYNSLLYSTGSSDASNTRISAMMSIFNEVLDAN